MFTRQERYIIAFLIIGAACGLGYSYYRRSHPPVDISFRKEAHPDIALQNELDRLLLEEGSVNVNLADFEELMKLKGVGPALAHEIIEYRRQNGPFQSVKDLLNVPGIGQKKLEAIEDRIVLE